MPEPSKIMSMHVPCSDLSLSSNFFPSEANLLCNPQLITAKGWWQRPFLNKIQKSVEHSGYACCASMLSRIGGMQRTGTKGNEQMTAVILS
jgi:hypothetical protein